MATSELHVQPVVWDQRGTRFAVLLLEGEAPDRSNGGAVLADALFRVLLARGLKLTTDLDRLPLAPTPGWRAQIDPDGGVTLRWPHPTPLLADAPLDLPEGWAPAARERGFVLVFAGYGLGLHGHAGNGLGHPVQRLPLAAESGALAVGVAPFASRDDSAVEHG